jgi:hypothetical protein
MLAPLGVSFLWWVSILFLRMNISYGNNISTWTHTTGNEYTCITMPLVNGFVDYDDTHNCNSSFNPLKAQ